MHTVGGLLFTGAGPTGLFPWLVSGCLFPSPGTGDSTGIVTVTVSHDTVLGSFTTAGTVTWHGAVLLPCR